MQVLQLTLKSLKHIVLLSMISEQNNARQVESSATLWFIHRILFLRLHIVLMNVFGKHLQVASLAAGFSPYFSLDAPLSPAHSITISCLDKLYSPNHMNRNFHQQCNFQSAVFIKCSKPNRYYSNTGWNGAWHCEAMQSNFSQNKLLNDTCNMITKFAGWISMGQTLFTVTEKRKPSFQSDYSW